MSAGLEASTVTPGSTAPDTSFTTPAMLPVVTDWAQAFAVVIARLSSNAALNINFLGLTGSPFVVTLHGRSDATVAQTTLAPLADSRVRRWLRSCRPTVLSRIVR